MGNGAFAKRLQATAPILDSTTFALGSHVAFSVAAYPDTDAWERPDLAKPKHTRRADHQGKSTLLGRG